jgi:iron complex outermembrane receptor protein
MPGRWTIAIALAALAMMALAGPGAALAQDGHDSIDRILVTAEGATDGRVADGYVIRNVRGFGILKGAEIKDVPFTVSVVGEDLMNNIGSMTPRDVFRMIPGVEDNAHSEINGFAYLRMRGFQATGSNNLAINGVPVGNIGAVLFTEDLSSIEVFSGLSGLMYGVGNVGGMANYNLKRGLFEPAAKLRMGTYNNGSLFAHADVGGPVAGDKLGLRLNLLLQDGQTAIKPQTLDRKLASLALDWKASDKLLIELSASYGEHRQQGRQGAFTGEWDNPMAALAAGDNTAYTGTPPAARRVYLDGIPDPPDPERLWVSKDTFNDYKVLTLGANASYSLDDDLGLRAGILYNRWKRRTLMTINYFTDDPDVYKYGVSPLVWDRKHLGAFLYLDAGFETLGMRHKVTLGANGYYREEFGSGMGGQYRAFYTSRFSLGDGVDVDLDRLDLFAALPPVAKTGDLMSLNIVAADEIRLGERWGLLAGLSRAMFNPRSFDAQGRITSAGARAAFTPSAAITFKPAPWLTTYASYIESLESMTAPANNVANPNEVLEPTVSRQYEVGAKAWIGGVMGTLAFYRIDRASNFTDPITRLYSNDGRARHVGAELSAQGRLFDSLNLYGGLAWNKATIRVSPGGAQNGKELPDAPRLTAKLYLEYDVGALPGLTLAGGLNHYGKVFTNPSNNLSIPGHTIAELGLRYAARIWERDVSLRLNVQNLTNERYWYGGTGSHLVVGQPRSFALLTETNF